MEASARAEIAVETLHEHGISFGEAVRVWIRVALLSFGGPAGQIAVMHRILVEEKRWIGEERFLHALNYCMLLPGPEAQQLAVYIGWLLHKTKGGLVAGALFVLPGFLAILGLSYVYVLLGEVPLVEGLFFGLKAAVLAVVLQAVVRVGSRALKNNVMRGFAALAFVAIFVLDVPFPLIVLAAALIGFFGGRAGYAAAAFAHIAVAGAGVRAVTGAGGMARRLDSGRGSGGVRRCWRVAGRHPQLAAADAAAASFTRAARRHIAASAGGRA